MSTRVYSEKLDLSIAFLQVLSLAVSWENSEHVWKQMIDGQTANHIQQRLKAHLWVGL